MINAVLIANRGEIACRIIRTAHRLGIRTVVVYSEVDTHSLAVQMADESYLIGPSSASESYLNIPKILAVAKSTKVEAIHPGYGFLSESPNFAKACREAGFIFIGPSLENLKKMGSKSKAKAIARKLGIPVIPGYEGNEMDLSERADQIGYPLMIKAVMGGGGKGIRRVNSKAEFQAALEACKREASAAFSNGEILIEKHIPNARHIEVQIFGDSYRNVVHLFERDCSLQRHHQKIIEEAPSSLPPEIKQKLYDAALKLSHTIHYEGAGTVEFLVDTAGHFYFMEMNTRLQVEHPVTEAITGIDLVEWQFRVASQEKLPLSQHEISSSGYALEARLYAEDPNNNFKPVTGDIWIHNLPKDVRIETGLHTQDTVTSYYDSLLAKLIVSGSTRAEILYRACLALENWNILGLQTNASFLKSLLQNKNIIENHIDIGFIDSHYDKLTLLCEVPKEVYVAASLIQILTQQLEEPTPWNDNHKWHLEGFSPLFFEWTCRGNVQTVSLTFSPKGWIIDSSECIEATLLENTLFLPTFSTPFWKKKDEISLVYHGETYFLKPHTNPMAHPSKEHEKAHLKAPLTGKVSLIFVSEGQLVQESQPLLILEAMKMEHLISAPNRGIIKQLFYHVGDVVKEGADVIDIQAQETLHDIPENR
ncbi:MAG: ATP-grasp domain-containing protein [Proteobacteria bacterium]|nr:ATP-grasp domain-containing protein [Pseudomonadota bacterium]